MRIMKKILAIFITAAMLLTQIPTAFAVGPAPSEQFSLTPGGTYYFNLSAQGIPDIVNGSLPDTSLKWVPFTYVGTVNAYSLNDSAMASTNAMPSDRSLFVAECSVTRNTVSWNVLNSAGLIFGKGYNTGGIGYTLRSLSGGGRDRFYNEGDTRGTPENNEWDQILSKDVTYLNTQFGVTSWVQDTCLFDSTKRVYRGYFWYEIWDIASPSDASIGFYPALEVLNPGALGYNGLKTVTYAMGADGKLGNGSLTSATVVYSGTLTLPAITAANGFSYTGSGTGILGWYDGTTFYAPGTTLTLATGTTLTAGYSNVVPNVITQSQSPGVTGRPYSDYLVATGDTPITWSISGGSLPGGLSLNASTGYITGTPTTEGTYNFTVMATNGAGSDTQPLSITIGPDPDIASVAAAKTAIVDGTVNVAFGATQADKTAAVQSYVNGLLTGDAEGVQTIVSYDSGADKYDVALSKGSASDSKLIAMTVSEAADPDIATVVTAFNLVDGAPYKNMTSEEAISEEVVANAVKDTAETAVNNSSVTVVVTKVWPGYILPTAGDADNPAGTNGRYGFKVTVSMGSQSRYTGWKYIDITATPFTGLSNAQAVTAAKAALIDGTVNVPFGASQGDKTAAVQTYVNGLLTGDAAGVTAAITYNSGAGKYDVVLSKGSVSDSKSLTMTVNEAPSITGPAILTLTEGYSATSTGIYTIMGTAPVTVTKTSGDAKITWDSITKKLDIAEGLTVGSYPVTLTASNGILPDATLTFILTVHAAPVAPTITGPTAMSLTEGYSATSTGVYTITGTAPVTVTKTSGDVKIIWNSITKKLDIAAGLIAGSYPVTLKASNGTSPDATLTFILTVSAASTPVTPTITGPATPTLTAGYNASVSGSDVSGKEIPKSAVDITVNSENASMKIGLEQSASITAGGRMIITVPTIPNVTAYTVGLPFESLSNTAGQGSLTLETNAGSMTLSANMLANTGAAGKNAELSIAMGDKSALSETARAAVGNRSLVRLSLKIDGEEASWNNPEAPVAVSIPYTPSAAELANPESIVIWYIDGSGNAVSVPNGHYVPATGAVTFTTTHFSNYAVGYNRVSFSDVAANDWFSKAVGFIVARKITTGTGNGNYGPNTKLTRGEFIVMLLKTYDIAPDTNTKDNFTDAGNTHYTNYLSAAKRLGISEGIGNNRFAPDKQITRQEMFTLLYNALKVTGRLPESKGGKDLTAFSDAGDIASWAKTAMTLLVKTGAVGGSGGKLSPAATATRAEMAQVLYNLLSR